MRRRVLTSRFTGLARPGLVGGALVLSVAALAAVWLMRESDEAVLPAEVENSLRLRSLEPNRWIAYHEERPRTWSRQGHAGMAFDTKRGTLLIFGSDTHGEDWDNAVHEFDPRRKRWATHQAPAGPETYRVDASGAAVAGATSLMPWAMHTYDAVEYHPALDALVVMSTTEHNPRDGSGAGIRRQPTWIYDLTTRHWRQFDNDGRPAPSFFGGSSAFDVRRGVLAAYRHGLWEMDATAGVWRQASPEVHHGMHHSMAYDTRRGVLFVFGDYQATNHVWTYLPGATAGQAGAWTRHAPQGDSCPRLSSVPVAYAADQDVFVLVVDNVEPGPPPRPKASAASTYFYDPEAKTCAKLPAGDLSPVGMNYMMAWDSSHGVVFLVTGDRGGTVNVWALKPQR
jgi:hypothetical protein